MFFNRIRITLNFTTTLCKYSQQKVPQPLRSKKPKSTKTPVQNFVDLKSLRATGGRGGDGCISFLRLWSNEFAGPDGGDGGNGGHVIFKACVATKDLINVPAVIRAKDGEKGTNKDCHGKNADHCIIDVPVGTVVKNATGKVVGDLTTEGIMFVAARGGAGGKGNHFFVTDTEQAPEVCEYGAVGEELEYTLEIRSMAHVGLIGFPNAGKSTLLRAVSRARPKVAPYPFTTLKPYVGMVQYDDYEQIAVADLPGLIPDSHKNRDMSSEKPWEYLETLRYELSQFNENLLERPQLVIANKIDLAESEANLELLKQHTDLKIIPISAKLGMNISELLREVRILYDQSIDNSS
ncbi:mitochondrial ribosome-associated GTPase 2 isoform X2 [Zophobas morio]|uniref:mitochondrial ribosome-associated GTPase 2 isoform X2 n=1 Tax=Zophobas morio TaxID=2755281 RepID=UPI0030833B39